MNQIYEIIHCMHIHCWKSFGVDHTQMIKKTEDDATFKSILRCEIAYRKRTSNDSKTRLHLYKLNQLSAAELKWTYTYSHNRIWCQFSSTIRNAHWSRDGENIAFRDRNEMNEQSETSPKPEVTVNEHCIVVWDFEKSKNGNLVFVWQKRVMDHILSNI